VAVPEDELRHRVSHMRQEREHVDFLEKTGSLVAKRLARGVPDQQRGSLAASLDALLRANRGLREAAGTAPDPGELAAEAALDHLLAQLRAG